MELEQISTPHSRWIFGGNGDFKNSVSVKENGYGEILISISIKNGVDMDMDMEYPSPLASLIIIIYSVFEFHSNKKKNYCMILFLINTSNF